MKNNNNNKIRKNISIIISIIFIIIISFFIIWYKKEKDVKVSETNNGKYEIYTETKGYVLNKETIITYNNDETLIPIAESEKRITTNSVIGIYKNEKYEKDLTQLAQMDEEINQKLQLLPEIYSNEVILIDKEIDIITKQMKNISSYIQMGDYKTKLDNLAYKKALTISSLTPSGSEVKSLILQRDKYKVNMNKSSNNVKASISGIIIYKNDGLENKFEINNINQFLQKDIDQVITEYNKTQEETFGIKIIDNYESYVIIKEDKLNDKYIIENMTYTIELLDKNSKISGILIKKISNDNYNYCIFKINNNIEEIVDLRKTDVKVIWKELTGLVVSNSSIKTLNNIDYITILSLNKYIDIPVKNLLKLDTISLIRNYTQDEKVELNLSEKRNLEVYDRVVESKK
ncbi:MAG: HlyD family efflux transporter periplasmic adaptor subunit [Clostridia bacterium]|nr:HlyD family efflux transporter periplasmic adaptor subunit [Clostridia bacterium]MDD4386203.1 HlyD family efflux transporter periplasmic adaptor subunit [Clostridia bacterium]